MARIDPAGLRQFTEGATCSGDYTGKHRVVRLRGVGDVVSEPSAELGEEPPHRAPVADRGDDCRRVLSRDSRAQCVPNRDVRPFELILGRQHVSRQRSSFVGDDLGGGQYLELAQRRFEGGGVRERRHQAPAEIEYGADVACLDLVDERGAWPFGHERLSVGAAPGARTERAIRR